MKLSKGKIQKLHNTKNQSQRKNIKKGKKRPANHNTLRKRHTNLATKTLKRKNKSTLYGGKENKLGDKFEELIDAMSEVLASKVASKIGSTGKTESQNPIIANKIASEKTGNAGDTLLNDLADGIATNTTTESNSQDATEETTSTTDTPKISTTESNSQDAIEETTSTTDTPTVVPTKESTTLNSNVKRSMHNSLKKTFGDVKQKSANTKAYLTDKAVSTINYPRKLLESRKGDTKNKRGDIDNTNSPILKGYKKSSSVSNEEPLTTTINPIHNKDDNSNLTKTKSAETTDTISKESPTSNQLLEKDTNKDALMEDHTNSSSVSNEEPLTTTINPIHNKDDNSNLTKTKSAETTDTISKESPTSNQLLEKDTNKDALMEDHTNSSSVSNEEPNSGILNPIHNKEDKSEESNPIATNPFDELMQKDYTTQPNNKVRKIVKEINDKVNKTQLEGQASSKSRKKKASPLVQQMFDNEKKAKKKAITNKGGAKKNRTRKLKGNKKGKKE
jgi:trimeric autotransporter adhesin